MYISLIKKISFGSLQVYKIIKSKWWNYYHLNKFHNKMFYMDNIVLNHILSGKDVMDQSQLFLSKYLDIYHFIFNMYNTFFKKNKSNNLKLYLPFILNSLNKYEVKDLFNIDLYPVEEKTRVISNLSLGKSFVYISYYHVIEKNDSIIMIDKNNFRDLVNHYHNRYDKFSHEGISTIDLKNMNLNIKNIYELIKENYLEKFHLDDVISLIEKYGFDQYVFSLSINMFLFYYSSSLVFDFKLLVNPFTNRTMNDSTLKDIVIKFFITLDKNMFYYKNLYGEIKFGEIKDERIDVLKRRLFTNKYVIKKRNGKVNIS